MSQLVITIEGLNRFVGGEVTVEGERYYYRGGISRITLEDKKIYVVLL